MKENKLPRASLLQGSWIEYWVRALAPLLIYVLSSYGLLALVPIAVDFGDNVTDVLAWGEITICIAFVFWYGKVSFEWTNDLGHLSWREVIAVSIFATCLCLLNVWVSQTFNTQDAVELTPMVFVGMIIAAPVLEEIVFRGFLFTRLVRLIDVPGAMILSSLAFAFGHTGAMHIVCAFIVGMALSVLLLRFRTLWVPVIAHILLNLTAYLGMYFEVTAVFALICLGLVVASGWWLYKTR